jgi:hypothetical protein
MLSRDEAFDPTFWRRLAPSFHIDDAAHFQRCAAIALGDNRRELLMGHLRYDGYLQESGLDFGVDLDAMAGLVAALSAAGIAPVFAFLFDEFWMPFRSLRTWYAGLLGDYAMMPDFWVWNLDPNRGDAGWPPHRDRNYSALLPDGSPKALTTWIPLTTAAPLNGCMYIVPASVDPTYGTPQEGDFRFGLPDVRALPAQPGDVLMWNHAVLHWGGRTSPRGSHSRISIAFEFQRRDVAPYNERLLDPGRLPGFEERLKLIGRQILQYRHMYRVDPASEALAARLVVG